MTSSITSSRVFRSYTSVRCANHSYSLFGKMNCNRPTRLINALSRKSSKIIYCELSSFSIYLTIEWSSRHRMEYSNSDVDRLYWGTEALRSCDVLDISIVGNIIHFKKSFTIQYFDSNKITIKKIIWLRRAAYHFLFDLERNVQSLGDDQVRWSTIDSLGGAASFINKIQQLLTPYAFSLRYQRNEDDPNHEHPEHSKAYRSTETCVITTLRTNAIALFELNCNFRKMFCSWTGNKSLTPSSATLNKPYR